MTIMDGQLYSASIGDSAFTDLTVTGDSSLTVKDQPNPVIRQTAMLEGADVQAGQILGDSFGRGQLLVTKPSNPLNEHRCKVKKNEVLQPQGYQDSGGAQVTTMLVGIEYGIGESRDRETTPGVDRGETVNITDGTNGWGTVVRTTGLRADKKYMLLGHYNVGASGLAIRYVHGDFLGMKPTLPALGTDVLEDDLVLFPKDRCPVFKGSEQLGVQGYGNGAANSVRVLLREL